MTTDNVLGSIRSWAFQVPPHPQVRVGPSQKRLSLVDCRRSKNFEEIKERIAKERGQKDVQTDAPHNATSEVPPVQPQQGERVRTV